MHAAGDEWRCMVLAKSFKELVQKHVADDPATSAICKSGPAVA